MKTIPLKPERQAELEEFARRRGKTPADALDEALATYLEWEKQDFEDAVRGIQQGYADVKAGQDAGVSGTPAFFINGRELTGAQPFEAFRRIIDEELILAKR